jgi:hypothetical protein
MLITGEAVWGVEYFIVTVLPVQFFYKSQPALKTEV